MSINSTVPLIRPPSEGAQSRRAAFVQNAGQAGGLPGVTGNSPFAGVLAQENQGRAVAGVNKGSPGSGGSTAGAGAAPGGTAAAGPFSAALAAKAQGAPAIAQGGTQGRTLDRLPGDRPIPPMLERAMPGLAPSGQGEQSGQSGKGKEQPPAPVVAGMGRSMLPEINRTNLARANTLAQVNMDKQRTQALENLAQNMGGDSPLDMARNSVTMRNLRTVVGGFSLRSPMPMSDSIKSQALQRGDRAGRTGRAGKGHAESTEIGKLASQFESGSDGIAAIGYDRVGGTSYGKYQIASRVGTMDGFLKFMDTAALDMAKQLRAAGPANTGSRKGAMPDAWRKLAAEQPERFEALQEKFIYDSHYKPALEAVAARTPLDEKHISSAMQEVLWSTAVQHGPAGAARIFTRAAEEAGKTMDKNYDKKVINNVYAIRAEQFGSSTEEVQQAVRNRMHKEKKLALNMLEQGSKRA